MTPEGAEPGRNSLFLAAHWLELGQPDRSLEELAQAGSVAVEDPTAHLIRAAALVDMDRHGEAIRAAEDGLALEPEHVGLLDVMATARWRQGDRVGAERAFLDALRLDTEDPVLLSRYALLVAQDGQLDKADRLIREAERIDPEETTSRYAAAVVAYLRGDDGEAGRRGREILSADPELVAAHGFLGRIESERGRVMKGAEHLRRAAALDPGSATHVEAARAMKAVTHPVLRPILLVDRFGPAKIWLVAIILIFGLRAAGFETASLVAALVYLTLAIYSWVAPPLVRWWVRRRL